VQLEVPYPLFEQMELLIEKHNGRLQTKIFAAAVTITAQFLVDNTPAFADAVRELSNGRLQTEIIDTSIGLW
jgi:putative IMPACT (imprinted ancient) family translation regulator